MVVVPCYARRSQSEKHSGEDCKPSGGLQIVTSLCPSALILGELAPKAYANRGTLIAMVEAAPSPLITLQADEDQSLSGCVLDAVSAVMVTPHTELPVLNDAIDPDALDAIFSGRGSNGQISFRYAGYPVSVHGDQVTVYEAGPSDQ